MRAFLVQGIASPRDRSESGELGGSSELSIQFVETKFRRNFPHFLNKKKNPQNLSVMSSHHHHYPHPLLSLFLNLDKK